MYVSLFSLFSLISLFYCHLATRIYFLLPHSSSSVYHSICLVWPSDLRVHEYLFSFFTLLVILNTKVHCTQCYSLPLSHSHSISLSLSLHFHLILIYILFLSTFNNTFRSRNTCVFSQTLTHKNKLVTSVKKNDKYCTNIQGKL